MNEINVLRLKKKIIHRCKFTGIKETDLLYQKLIVNKINKLTSNELIKLLTLFQEISDADIFQILTKKKHSNKKYKKLFEKLIK